MRERRAKKRNNKPRSKSGPTRCAQFPRADLPLHKKLFLLFPLCTFFLFFTISSSSSHSAYIKTIYSYVCAVRLIYKPSPCHPEKKCLCAPSAADFSFSVTTRAVPTANYLFAAKNLRLYFTFFGSSLYLLLI